MPTMFSNLESSRKFWDQKAKENPYWYVSSYGPYAGRNIEEFWQSGTTIWSELKEATRFRPNKFATVVEIGCGVGRLTRAIAPEVGTVLAFDISAEMLDIARSNVPKNAILHIAQGCSLKPVPQAAADLVLAYCVFQHLPDIESLRSYLCEMMRVAKPGGVIAFTVCQRDWKWSLLPLMRARGFVKSKLGLQPPDLYKKEWLGIRPSISQIQKMCSLPLSVKALGGDRTLLWSVAH